MSDFTTDVLRHEVQQFLQQTGMGPTYFGVRAVKNARLVERLEAGRTVTLTTAERIRKFIQNHSASQFGGGPGPLIAGDEGKQSRP